MQANTTTAIVAGLGMALLLVMLPILVIALGGQPLGETGDATLPSEAPTRCIGPYAIAGC